MTDNSQVECWTPFHLKWSLGVGIPFGLLWGIILPFLLLRKIRKITKNPSNDKVDSSFTFTYEGLKSDNYYW